MLAFPRVRRHFSLRPQTTILDPIDQPHRSPRRAVISGWRSLPLTAQLGTVGMLVAIAWFLTARAATERQDAAQRDRAAALADLHSAELVATRLGTTMATMAAAYRGFVLSGREDFLAQYTAGWPLLESVVGMLRQRTVSRGWLVADVNRVHATARRWHDSIVAPNIALGRAQGIAAFAPGTLGADRTVLGLGLINRAAAQQAKLLRDIRNEVADAESDLERQTAFDELESILILVTAVVIFLLLGTLLLRVVARALEQVVVAADALAVGHYANARLPAVQSAPSQELGQLAQTFERLAANLEQRERLLHDDIDKLRELERMKAEFVSTVSHELRTPLTSMRGALGLMLGGKVGEISVRGRELLQIAMTNTERLIRLINDILDIEKMDAGQMSTRHDLIRLKPLLETTVAGLDPLARDAKVTLRITTTTDAEVIGDADRLIQVLTNLVSNAVKFSPAESVVDISLVTDAGQVAVRVRDHGPGISPEFAGRIFGRLQQAGGADSRRKDGTGLGLNIAKAIIEMHGGVIGFEPAPGGGTIFWIRLPIAQAAPVDERPAILVVEDDSLLRDVLVAQLEALARPMSVPSAEAALELLERETVAGIILDPELPGMNGLEFPQRLRADARLRRLPILLYSAREYDPETLRKAGVRASDAFVKSRDAEDVMFDRLRAALRLVPQRV